MNQWKVSAIALSIGITGCSNSLLYDANRDKQAQELVKTVEDAHLGATVESLNKAFADVAAKEEAAVQLRARALFDWEIENVARARSLDSRFTPANADIDGLATVIRRRLNELGLSNTSDDALGTLRTSQATIEADTKAIDLQVSTFQGSFGVAFKDCTEIDAASDESPPAGVRLSQKFLKRVRGATPEAANVQFADLVANCNALAQKIAERDRTFTGGVVAKVRAQLEQNRAERSTQARVRANAETEIARIKADAAVFIDSAKPGKSKLEAVQEAAAKINGRLDDLRKLDELLSAELFAKESVGQLESLLVSIAGSPADAKVALTSEQLVGVEIVRSLPALGDEARKLLADAAKPRLVPFLAAIQHQQLELERIGAINRASQKESDALQRQFDVSLEEALALARVLQPISKPEWQARSIGDLNKSLDASEKRTLHAALAMYGDEVGQKRIEAAIWQSRALAASYERGLINSTYAARQWDALMDLPARVLADYHAAGIKSEDLMEFFKALGLVAVGVGAAQ